MGNLVSVQDNSSVSDPLRGLITKGDFGGTVRYLSTLRVQEMRLALLKYGFSVTATRSKAQLLAEIRGQIEGACAAGVLPRKTPLTNQGD